MTGFRSMGCDVVLPDGAADARVRALFDERDRRFSRFLPSSELNRVNAMPRGLTSLSEEFASMLSLALDAARATGGLVTPAAGEALLAAGCDRDFDGLPTDEVAVVPAHVPSLTALLLRLAGPSWLDRRGLPGRFVSTSGTVAANQTWQQLAPARAAA